MYYGLPLTLYHAILINKSIHTLRVEQVRFFFKLLIIYITGTILWLLYIGKYDFYSALRYASFNIISLTTSTGFTSTNYLEWGAFSATIFIIFALTGGCTGSTAGSIKIFRWQVLLAYLKKSLITAVEPNRVVPVKIGRLASDGKVVHSVFTFFVAYFFCFIILAILVGLSGIDFETSLASVIACITNTGPSISPATGPVGNYAIFNDFSKYVLSFAMLLGRLDILTVVVIFTRSFWQK